MTFDPLAENGVPLERQLRNWSELNVEPYNTRAVHPYTRTRIITMNGIEVASILDSHQAARWLTDTGVKQRMAEVRRVEQQQQKAVNWLVPGEESTIAVTVGYEQVAVDLTAWAARNEPDPYLRQVYEFGVLEDFDHLYRYSNLMDLMGEGRKAEEITGKYTEITPGRPTIFEHRHPHDDLRRPMTKEACDRQSILNAMTILAAEQQTMNYYMNVGNRPTEPIARALYMEIAQIEEQHVSHYESIMDPTLSWMARWVLHEFHECWTYWSCLQEETDPGVKAIWELHLAQEIEHFKLAWRTLEEVERRDAREVLPDTVLTNPMRFHENKSWLRDLVDRQVDLTGFDSQFVPVTDLPEGHRYFAYQSAVNGKGAPSEAVIRQHVERFGDDYRHETEGPHPVKGLRDGGYGAPGYARAAEKHVHPTH
jgi:hypothetical protein